MYEGCIRRFLAKDPDIDDINEYNSFLVSTAYKKRQWYYYFLFKHYLNFKVDNGDFEGAVRRKIFDDLIKPVYLDPQRMTPRVTRDERDDVISRISKIKHQIIAKIQKETGARANDVMKLKLQNVSNEILDNKPVYRLILISKGRKRTPEFLFDEDLQNWFHEYLLKYNNSIQDYVFLEKGNMKGREGQLDNEHKMYRMNYQWYCYDLKQAVQKSGIKNKNFSSHDFRRNFAVDIWTNKGKSGRNIKVLQDVLHHQDPKTTMRYLRNEGLDTMETLYEYQMNKDNQA